MKSARGLLSAMSATLTAVLVIVAILSQAPAPRAAGRGEPGPVYEARVELADRQTDLQRLYDLDILIDGVYDGWARVYLVEKELRKLEANGFLVTILPQPPRERPVDVPETDPGGGTVPAAYHTYATLTADMQAVAAAHPDITRLISIGQTVQNREMWMMKISDNPDIEEDEPEFSYISSMHGDEVVGKELSYNLIVYLTDNYGTDPRVTDLIDNTEIWIMPSMNPDGTEMHQRFNANGYDLNRNFPDQFDDPVNTPDGRQPETQRVMNWMLDRRIVLAANMHGGELIVNYPMDGNPAGASVFSPAPDPDHDTYVSVSRSYADNNPPMSLVNGGSFDNGITNGADWYAINGGMQDWNYVWHGGMEVTLEVSVIKWPDASTLPGFWDDNLESMLTYMERVHEGVRGIVTDAVSGQPLQATIPDRRQPLSGLHRCGRRRLPPPPAARYLLDDRLLRFVRDPGRSDHDRRRTGDALRHCARTRAGRSATDRESGRRRAGRRRLARRGRGLGPVRDAAQRRTLRDECHR